MRARIGAVAVVLTGAVAAAQSPAPKIDAIRQDNLRTDLTVLSADAMKGRLTNTPENLEAAEWVKSRFEKAGVSPLLSNYFHNYNLITVSLGATNTLKIAQPFNAGNTNVAMQGRTVAEVPQGEGWYTHRFSATGEARGELTFAGYGISAPDMGYDDYRAASLIKGSVVLVIDHEPGERDPASPFDGVVTSDNGGAMRKAQAAARAGAVAILFVSDVHNHPGSGATFNGRAAWPPQPSRLGSYSLEAWTDRVTIPAAQISPALAADLVKGSGKTLEELSKLADTPNGIAALPLPGPEVQIATSVTRTKVPDRNVLAKIEGSDPALRDEWVVVSAHFDHDGANGDQIFNGADDDGSGTVGLLAIADAFAQAAKAGQRPRRSILFAAFNSEERGLLGAWAFVEQPPIPLDKIVACLNMDMIGRNEEVPAPAPAAAGGRAGGGGRFSGLEPQTAESNANALNIIGAVRSPDLQAGADRANKAIGLEIRYRYDNNSSQLMRRSDHWPFIQKGIPGIWIFTGLHPDYHTVNDDADRINYAKMEKILKLTYQMSWDLAQADSKPKLLPRR